jgi:hypothetical protein
LNWFAIVGAIGGIIGMIGGLLSLRDRFAKGRPIASLTTTTQGSRKLLTIRIKNTTEYDVVIDGASERRGVYFLVEDFDTSNL